MLLSLHPQEQKEESDQGKQRIKFLHFKLQLKRSIPELSEIESKISLQIGIRGLQEIPSGH
jgi:hypothetical protein